MSHSGLDSVKLCIELLKIREGPQMDRLDIVSYVLILEEKFSDFVPEVNLFEICSWLFQPLFEESCANLSLTLVKEAKE